MNDIQEIIGQEPKDKMMKKKQSELRLWKDNPRGIKTKDFERLKKQIKELGLYKPFLITEDGEVLGGNMRLRACKELGIEEVPVSIVKPKNEAQKLAYALSDNDRAGYYEEDRLAELIDKYKNDIDLGDYKVDLGKPIDLQELLDRYSPVEEDEVPKVSEGEPESKLGEVYQLGRHRLMCGDSTKKEDVEKLMDGKKADMAFCDPPYGVSYGDKNVFLNEVWPANRIQENIEADTLEPEEVKKLWFNSWVNMKNVLKSGGCFYICSADADLMMMMMMMSLAEAKLLHRQLIVWVKNNIVIGRRDYKAQHENLLYGWNDGGHKFYGGAGESTVWNIDKPMHSRLHPTMKPIALMAKAIKNSSKQDEIVLDLFGGSGSTLIACEQTNRICYMMEIDEKYCDVIRKRYTKFISKEKE